VLIGISLFLGVTRRSLFMIWVALELNLLRFLLILMGITSESIFVSIKYFIVQRTGSAVFFLTRLWLESASTSPLLIIYSVALIFKLGGAPFQGWVHSVAKALTWNLFFVLMTLQKVLPLLVLLDRHFIFYRVYPILAVGVAVVGAAREVDYKKILVYSSVLRLGWILTAERAFCGLVFLGVYRLGLRVLTSIFNSVRSGGLVRVQNVSLSNSSNLIIFIALLSLIGVPPLLGFYPKLILLIILTEHQAVVQAVALLIGSSFFIFVYLRLCLSSIELTPRWLAFRQSGAWAPAVFSMVVIGGLLLLCVLCVILSFDLNSDKEAYHT